MLAQLPQLIGPPDGGAGQVLNPWPLVNVAVWSLIVMGVVVFFVVVILSKNKEEP